MRIIAGDRRGARISAPKGTATRPTGDRVREAAYNLLGPVDDTAVLDLFAGSGAMGLEALSRGARRCVFVESDRAACAVIRDNLEKLRLTGALVLQKDVFQALREERGAGRTYDLVLVDPPYGAWPDLEQRLADALPSVLDGRRRDRRGDLCEDRAGASAHCRHEPPLRFCTNHRLHPMITAICPGSYDPVTLGHLDVIGRAAATFDRVVVGVVRDPHHKQTLFTVEERVAFLEEAVAGHANVTVDVFHELVVDFARKHDAKTMVKGLRVIADFEWEFQMNRLNHLLAPEIETMYVMSSPQYSFISSSGVKEIASFGGKVDELVPEAVARRFRELFPNGRPGAPLSPQE